MLRRQSQLMLDNVRFAARQTAAIWRQERPQTRIAGAPTRTFRRNCLRACRSISTTAPASAAHAWKNSTSKKASPRRARRAFIPIERYFPDVATNFSSSSYYAHGHFRHGQRANAAFADGHVEVEKAVPGSYDPRLPSQHLGQLPPEILLLQ
jgi:prepilin-type processing-associated H-X9-DG protein